jgi:hypothetical protein
VKHRRNNQARVCISDETSYENFTPASNRESFNPAMLQSRSRIMRTFSKQLVLLALGLVLSSSMASQANAAIDANCPTIAIGGGDETGGPLKPNEAYGFNAFGADSSGGANATVTMVGDVETDANGCPSIVYFGFNDNGTACTGTFSSVVTANTPAAVTGTMTWTPVTGCIVSANVLDFNYANAPTSKVMYFSNNGGGAGLGPDLVVAGKLQDNGPTDTTISTCSGACAGALPGVKKHHHH